MEVVVVVLSILVILFGGKQSDSERLNNLLSQVQGVKVEEREGNAVIFFNDAFFDTGKSELTKDAEKIADEVSKVLASEFITRYLYVEGHTDNRGSQAGNQRLSKLRANVVADRILTAGNKPSNITIMGYASKYPECSNETIEGRSCNRRVQIVVIKKGKKNAGA